MNERIKVIKLGFVNAYLVEVGDGFILIDTGVAQQWKKVETELTSAGCLPDKLKLVVITHGDFDHTGNGAKLQEKYKAKIAMHPADSFMVENGVQMNRKIRTLSARIILLLGKWLNRNASFEKFRPDLFLTDGQSMEPYGLDARIIHVPGHTKGSIAILTHEGDLFIGDILFNTRKPDIAPFIDDFEDMKKSVDKLRELKIRMIYPGHGKPFSGDVISKISMQAIQVAVAADRG
jgi:hydroxyacylglutathione hydrolase